MNRWIADLSAAELATKLRTRVLPNLRHLRHSRLRRCGCCGSRTLFVALAPSEEFQVCLRCRANLRYEMLADCIRTRFPDLAGAVVLELDPASPLRHLLRTAGTYVRSYYRPQVRPGTVRPDGARCEDVQGLTCPDASVDLIVSSDVLEHVPDIAAALRETARVLRPGGVHLFTVPPRETTRQRARLTPSGVEHLLPAEYHLDPLDPRGVLVFWDFGPDLPGVFPTPDLRLRIVDGPRGKDRRVVWAAERV